MVTALTFPCTELIFRKWTRRVFWSLLAISTKSIPLSLVLVAVSSSFCRRSLGCISGHQNYNLFVSAGFNQDVINLNKELRFIALVRRTHSYLLHLNLVTQPAIERLLHQDLRCGVERL